VSIKDLLAEATLNVPDAYGPVGRTGDKHIALVLQSPDTTLVTLELLAEFTRLCVVDVNEGIVAASNDLVLVKLETSNHMSRMSCKGNMAGFYLTTGPALADHVVTTVE
jgi:hypothetical protein